MCNRLSVRVGRCLVLAYIALWGGCSSATAATVPVTAEQAQRVIARAEHDPQVQQRLALRPGDYDIRVVRHVATDDEASAPVLGQSGASTTYEVTWSRDGRARLSVVVSADLRTTSNATGQSLTVMPGAATTTTQQQQQSWKPWALLGVFTVVVSAWWAAARATLRMSVPLLGLAAAHVLTVENLVPPRYIRSGNIALDVLATGSLIVGAAWWLRRSPGSSVQKRRVWIPTWLSAALVAAVLVGEISSVVKTPMLTDVALASQAGARLVAGGVVVYGNVLDIPGSVVNGDTYGPAAYLAYAPAVHFTDSTNLAIVGTNVGLQVLVAIVLVLVGRRLVDLRTRALASATWMCCPFVALGTVTGNNDIVVAAIMAVLLIVVARPAWRGVAIAVAAAAKFVPLLALLPALALRGDPPRSWLRVLLAAMLTAAALFAIALHGGTASTAFWNASVRYQAHRDDIGSLWGLAGISPARYGALAIAVATALWSSWRGLRQNPSAAQVLLRVAAVLALALAALPQYWGTYATWIVPLLLGAQLHILAHENARSVSPEE